MFLFVSLWVVSHGWGHHRWAQGGAGTSFEGDQPAFGSAILKVQNECLVGRVLAPPQVYADRLPAQFQGKSPDGLPSSSSVTKSGWTWLKSCLKSSVYSSRQLATGTIGLSRVRYASGRTRSAVLHRTLWKPAPHCRRSHFYRDAVCLSRRRSVWPLG